MPPRMVMSKTMHTFRHVNIVPTASPTWQWGTLKIQAKNNMSKKWALLPLGGFGRNLPLWQVLSFAKIYWNHHQDFAFQFHLLIRHILFCLLVLFICDWVCLLLHDVSHCIWTLSFWIWPTKMGVCLNYKTATWDLWNLFLCIWAPFIFCSFSLLLALPIFVWSWDHTFIILAGCLLME